MKKLILTGILCFCLVSPLLAGENIELNTSAYAATYAVTCSNTMATEIFSTSGWLTSIYLIPETTTYTVYIATYAATSPTNLYPLKNRELKIDISPYQGPLYGLSEAGQQIILRVLKIWRR